MCSCGGSKPANPSGEKGGNPKPPAAKVEPCKTCKLVSITVIQNATQTNVTGAKNWACVKKATDDVIVQATTTPNTEDCWKQINWSDAGDPVSGKANQRKLSRANSKKYTVTAELCGVSDELNVWVLWGTVQNLTTGTTPANAVQFGARYDGTENLGARSYDAGNSAVGKVVPVATLTPPGVNAVVKAGWTFKREKMRHDFQDGTKDASRWDTTWQDDTSDASFQKLIPDPNDKIYDRDAPNISDFGVTDSYERYDNFREWVEWNGDRCADNAGWYWKARWKKDQSPQVTLKEVAPGEISPLPGVSDNFYPPPPPP
jgi:hypothetical protein